MWLFSMLNFYIDWKRLKLGTYIQNRNTVRYTFFALVVRYMHVIYKFQYECEDIPEQISLFVLIFIFIFIHCVCVFQFSERI